MPQDEYITIEVTEKQLATLISGLLFSCSVNIVSDAHASNEEYVQEIFELARRLKNIKPDVSLDGIQFLEEPDYEESISKDILREFEGNIQLVTFEELEK